MNVVPINQQHTQPWTVRAKTFVQSASTMTLLVGGALGSAALLYQQPQQWLFTATSVSLVSLYATPKILRHGNTWMVKTAIAVSLAALGSLALGGSLVASLTMGKALIISYQINSLTASLFSSFFFTGLVGYAIPHSCSILQKAHSMLNHSYWQARFACLTKHFNNLPQLGCGFLQTNILPYISLYAALVAPNQFQSLCQTLYIDPQPYLQAVIKNSLPPGTNQLNIIQRFFGHLPLAQQQDEETRGETIAVVLDNLKYILDYLSPEELDAEIDLLLDQSCQIVPLQLSREEFLSLFQGSTQRAMNAKIEHFLNEMASLPAQQERYNQLIAESEGLRVAIEEQRVVNGAPDSQQLLELDQRYMQLRSEIEHVHRQRQNWKNFRLALEGIDRNLLDHFARFEEVEQLLQNQAAIRSFESFYLSMYGFNPQEELSLIDRIQRITNLLNENAALKAWSFLGSDNCGFEADDYNELCRWLGVHSFNDIEAKMVEIGLSTEEDLYANNILPRQPIIPKDQIKNSLRQYIGERLESQGTFRNRVYRALAQVSQIQVNAISKKVSQVIYRAITMGLILVPVCLYPIASGIGFGCGLIYFILKRFGRDFGAAVGGLENALFRDRIAQIVTNFATERNLFSLSLQSRENMETFSQSNLFGRMRMINFEILATMAITYLPDSLCHDFHPIGTLGLGGFIQGSVLAKEVINLF